MDLLSAWSTALARVTGGACTPSGAAQRGAVLLFARYRRACCAAAATGCDAPAACDPLDEPLDVDTLLVHATQPVGGDQAPQLAASLWCVQCPSFRYLWGLPVAMRAVQC